MPRCRILGTEDCGTARLTLLRCGRLKNVPVDRPKFVAPGEELRSGALLKFAPPEKKFDPPEKPPVLIPPPPIPAPKLPTPTPPLTPPRPPPAPPMPPPADMPCAPPMLTLTPARPPANAPDVVASATKATPASNAARSPSRDVF